MKMHLFSTDTELATVSSNIFIKVHLTNAWVYLGFLHEYKWEVNFRILSMWKTTTLSKSYASVGEDLERLHPCRFFSCPADSLAHWKIASPCPQHLFTATIALNRDILSFISFRFHGLMRCYLLILISSHCPFQLEEIEKDFKFLSVY